MSGDTLSVTVYNSDDEIHSAESCLEGSTMVGSLSTEDNVSVSE